MSETIEGETVIETESEPMATVDDEAIGKPATITSGYRVSRDIACLSDPEGEAAETIRSLRAHLFATHVREGRRSIAICAPQAEAGSTYVAVNLAVAFAQAGVNTLLVDGNLHEPGLENFIQPAETVGGLRQMLTGDPLNRVDQIRRGVMSNLSLLYSGGIGANSSELIANREFKTLLDDCFRDFELTIVDTAATGGTADMRRIAMNTRYALIVARRDVTFVSQIRSLAHELTNDHVRVIGTFLTDF